MLYIIFNKLIMKQHKFIWTCRVLNRLPPDSQSFPLNTEPVYERRLMIKHEIGLATKQGSELLFKDMTLEYITINGCCYFRIEIMSLFSPAISVPDGNK